MVAVQLPVVRAIVSALDVSPPDITLPSLDERTVVQVLPLPAEWLVPGLFGLTTAAFDIGGGQAVFLDDGSAGSNLAITMQYGDRTPANGPIDTVDALFNRSYSNISIAFNGGVTNPITGSIQTGVVGGTNIIISNFSVANPGRVSAGPLLVPSGLRLRIVSLSGGALDTMNVQAVGAKAPPGRPLLIQSPFEVRTT